MSTIDLITQKTGVTFRTASAAAIQALHALGVPEEIIKFYRQFEPAKCVEIGKVRIWPVADMLQENRDCVPGCYACPCGYVVFSTTINGDAYCFDLRAASSNSAIPIVLIAHDLQPENDEMKREELAKLAKPISPSFESFLEAFVSGTLDIEPLYPPFDFGNQPEAKTLNAISRIQIVRWAANSAFSFLGLLSLFSANQGAAQEKLTLKPTPKTVAWGYYDAKATPVLRIKSGDTVEIQTLITNSPKRLEDAGVPPDQIEQSLRDITDQLKDKGPGGHILTGPIYIEGAEQGDVLEVKILSIKLAIPYAYNAFGPGRGYLPDDYPYSKIRIIPLDEKRMVAKFAPGIEIPLHPFFGSMGDAPPESAGRFNSAPPWVMAGNLDNKDLVAGSTLYIPVHAPGALFEVGDGHAGQGDGEVDITALETSLLGTFQFIVRKDLHLKWPRAETPTHYITMGLNDDLNACATLAVREMINFLMTEKHLSRDDAYMLSSVAADLHITELVDGNKGVHMMLPKSIFVSGPAK